MVVKSARGDIHVLLQVNSLDELYDDVPPDESEDHFDIVVIVLLSTIVASILGCLTTILLIIGVSRKSSLFFLPWLIWHMLEILGSVASGSEILTSSCQLQSGTVIYFEGH